MAETFAHIAGVVLAAGEGKRLRPHTLTRPKPLMPFCGISLLELNIRRLTMLPHNRVAINCAYLGEQIEAEVHQVAPSLPLPCFMSHETAPLGTGGGIRQALPVLGDFEYLLVHNADILLDYPLETLVERHLAQQHLATLLVTTQGPRTLRLSDDGRILDYHCRPGEGTHTFTGVHLLDRRVLKYLRLEDPACIVAAYERAQQDG